MADLKDSTKEALEQVAEPARKAGLTVEFSGGVVSTTEGESSAGEQIGVVVAFFVLLISFGSALIAALPLITALIGVPIGLSAIFALTAVTELNSTAPTLATMLGLAVGIDYSLFIVARYREERRKGFDPNGAIGAAGATASRAVFFSGLTVVLALLGMFIIPTTIFRSMATGAIVGQ